MKELVFFLEERSAKAMLEGLLPRLLSPNTACHYVIFEGKQDLEKQLGRRLRHWCNPDACFVVLRDQDAADCVAVKQQLVAICQEAGKPQTLVRIVCRELESWYLGDLQAVESGLNLRGLARQQQKSKFRQPDQLSNAKQELRRLTGNRYQQISGSREIGRRLSVDGNLSESFNVFVAGIRRCIHQETNP